MSLVLSIDMLDRLLRVPVQERKMAWAHDICTASRFVHVEVWSSSCENEFVEDKVIPLLSKAQAVLNAMLETDDSDTAMREALQLTIRNIGYRIENLCGNYLKGMPSVFRPDPKLSEPAAKAVLEKPDKEKRVYFIDEYYERCDIRLGDVNVSVGNINLIERFERIEYDQRSGITQEQFDRLKASIAALSQETREVLNKKFAQLAAADTKSKKESAAKKILCLLRDKGVEVAKEITVEFIKKWFWPN